MNISQVPQAARNMAAAVRRFGGWWLVTGLLLAVVYTAAPQQIGILVYKTLLVAAAVALSYAASKSLFRNAPGISADMPRDNFSAALLLARAIVAHAVISGLTGGL